MSTARDTVGQLRGREAILLAGMLAGMTVTEAGKAAGMSRSAAYRVRAKQNFQTALQDARSELLEGTIDRLRTISRSAVDTLEEVATDAPPRPEASPDGKLVTSKVSAQARVSAAREALAALFRGLEIWELERRDSKLEQVGAAGQEQPVTEFPDQAPPRDWVSPNRARSDGKRAGGRAK